MYENMSSEFHKLVALLKEKLANNTTYYIVMNDFSKDDFKIFKRAMFIPSLLGGDSDNIVMSVIYKVLPKDVESIESIEGIINISYVDLASLLISEKIVARYTEINKTDKEIDELVKKIKNK